MKVDLAAFQRHYLSGLTLPLSLAAGWRATGVREDRIRWAVDFDLVDAEGRAVLLYVERRLSGRRACCGRPRTGDGDVCDTWLCSGSGSGRRRGA